MTNPGPRASTTGNRKHSADTLNRAICGARIVFFSCLLLVAIALGSVAHYFLSNAEKELADSQYESIADRALTGARRLANQKRWAAVGVAAMISENYPNASAWPFVSIRGFERIITSLLHTAANVDMGFSPVVYPDQLNEWEKFIVDYYENERKPPIPSNFTTSSFGQGVWAVNTTLNTIDKRFHDTGTYTTFHSPNQIVTPLTDVNEEYQSALLYNVHSEPSRGQLIDRIIQCSSERKDESQADLDTLECTGITTMLLYFADETKRPSSSIYVPIYPADTPNTVRLILCRCCDLVNCRIVFGNLTLLLDIIWMFLVHSSWSDLFRRSLYGKSYSRTHLPAE
jgi:hypothetical protein